MTQKQQKPIKIVIVDDHVILRDGIVSLLAAQPDFEVVGEAGTIAGAVSKVRQTMPDVVLMDYGLPDGTGLEATRSILAFQPDVKIVFLTVHEEDDSLFAAIRNGAKGYLLKNISAAELLNRLRGLARGKAALSSQMTDQILTEFAKTAPPAETSGENPKLLTPRQLEVLQMMAKGASNKEIAREMVISLYTVKNHVHNILVALGAEDRREAVRMAIGRGLLRPGINNR